ncbi:MAG: hypothetical protein LBU32_01355 [Clostridiales bacterium]|jgi:hypothetical protein|nr:hypothetical protein [Clostridiales bacterium]
MAGKGYAPEEIASLLDIPLEQTLKLSAKDYKMLRQKPDGVKSSGVACLTLH